jgi:hypothetical protein
LLLGLSLQSIPREGRVWPMTKPAFPMRRPYGTRLTSVQGSLWSDLSRDQSGTVAPTLPFFNASGSFRGTYTMPPKKKARPSLIAGGRIGNANCD